MAITCEKCGTTYADDALACARCGFPDTQFANRIAAVQSPEPTVSSPPLSEEWRKYEMSKSALDDMGPVRKLLDIHLTAEGCILVSRLLSLERAPHTALRFCRTRDGKGLELIGDPDPPGPDDYSITLDGMTFIASPIIVDAVSGTTVDGNYGRLRFLRRGVSLPTAEDADADRQALIHSVTQRNYDRPGTEQNGDPSPGFMDPDAELPVSFGDYTHAKRYLKLLKLQFPAVPSAYRPSGIIPSGGITALMRGAVRGGVLGGVAGIIALVISVGSLWLADFLSRVHPVLGIVSLILIMIGILFGFVGYPAVAMVSCFPVTRASSRVMNRNGAAVAVVAMGAAFLGVLFAWGIVWLLTRVPGVSESINSWIAAEWASGGRKWFVDNLYVVNAAGFLVAVSMAVWMARGEFRRMRFCEQCGRPMTTSLLVSSLTAGEVSAAVDLLGAGQIEELCARLAHPTGGAHGSLDVDACPLCGVGFADLRFRFFARGWPHQGKYNFAPASIAEDWIVASRRITGDEVEAIRIAQKSRSQVT